MKHIESVGASDTWIKASQLVLNEGVKEGSIIEIINGFITITEFQEDPEFDAHFREIFGDDRIDYASSVTFIEPVPSKNLMFPDELHYPLCKPRWKDSYWGRMTRYDDKFNQVEEVLKILREGKRTKRCELIVYSPYDIKNMYKQPCMLTIDLKPRNGDLYLSAVLRSQRISKSGYADYSALIDMGKWLAEQSDMTLKEVNILAHSFHLNATGDEMRNTKALLERVCDS